MSNPQLFAKECKALNITYDYLNEAKECIGSQSLARMFAGKSKRGGGGFVSAASVENWIVTLKYALDNPEEKDKDVYQAREINPFPTWDEYVKLIKTPIDDPVIESWKSISLTKLGDEAEKYGLTIGIRNSKARQNLRERMLDMSLRRKKLFWNNIQNSDIEEEKSVEINYNFYNIFKLREMVQEHGMCSNGLNKEQLIDLLLEKNTIIEEKTYNDMTLMDLKNLAKDNGFNEYNNMKKEELIIALEKYDQERQKELETKLEDKDKITMCGITVVSRKEDNYINATQLCQAGSKKFNDWYRLQKTEEFLKEFSTATGIPVSMLIQIGSGNNFATGESSTWIHPKCSIQLAQWISPKFSVKVSEWIYELLSTGSVKLERPVRALTDLNEYDIEAEQMEYALTNFEDFSNDMVLYIAYVGEFLKIGYSDGKLVGRNLKHQSSESSYKQWRLVKLFKISGRPVEKDVHEFLRPYKVDFGRQKEIFKPSKMTITAFCDKIETFLKSNDLKMRCQILEKENMALKLENSELKLRLKE
jgi:hypothetical protein